jgi:peptidoglycan/LPS O-acetylase OafA/YrhL
MAVPSGGREEPRARPSGRWLLPTPGTHRVQLDSLRAFAVLGVLATHFAPATKVVAPLGDFGVRLFFVLSGFLITGILLRAGQDGRPHTLRQFYARRFLRIFPAFYLVLFVAAVLAVPGIRGGLGWSATYLSNFWFIFHPWHNPNYMSQFWTLAVEEQFYLVIPAVVLFAPRRYLPTILLVAAGVAIAYRAGALAAGWSWDAYTRAPTACLDSLGLGALLAVLRARGMSDRWTRWALALGLPLLAIDLTANTLALERWSNSMLDFQHVLQDTAFALVSVWLVARASEGFRGVAGRALSLSPLVYLGTISYGIYLYHYFAIWGFNSRFGWTRGIYPNQAIYFLVLTSATVALASVSWFVLERPVNNLKRRFPYGAPDGAERGKDTARGTRTVPQYAILRARALAIVVLVITFVLAMTVAMPEALGDRPYNVIGH